MRKTTLIPKPKERVDAQPSNATDLPAHDKRQLKHYTDAKAGKSGTDFAAAIGTDMATRPTNEQVSAQINAATEGFARTSDIPPAQDLSQYAKKSEIPDVSGFAKKSEIPAPVDLSGYATRAELPDLSPYAKKSELPKGVNLSGYATESFVHTKLTEALAGVAKKTELPTPVDLSGYPTKAQVTEQLNAAVNAAIVPGVSEQRANEIAAEALKGYATTEYVANAVASAGGNNQAPDLSAYVKKSELPTQPDLSTYAKKSDIPAPVNLVGYATESFVEGKIAQIPAPDLSAYAKKMELPDTSRFQTAEEVQASVFGVVDSAVQQSLALGGLKDELITEVVERLRGQSSASSSPYKEYEHRRVMRSTLKATGAGNLQEWEVKFRKPFSDIPFVNLCSYRSDKIQSTWLVYNISTTGFTFSCSYAGPDTVIAYEAFVPND